MWNATKAQPSLAAPDFTVMERGIHIVDQNIV